MGKDKSAKGNYNIFLNKITIKIQYIKMWGMFPEQYTERIYKSNVYVRKERC